MPLMGDSQVLAQSSTTRSPGINGRAEAAPPFYGHDSDPVSPSGATLKDDLHRPSTIISRGGGHNSAKEKKNSPKKQQEKSPPSRSNTKTTKYKKPAGFGRLAKRVQAKIGQGKPKRPLSAYNIFFKDERAAIMREQFLQSEKVQNRRDEDPTAANGLPTSVATKKKRHKKSHNKRIGFEDLAKQISTRWKNISAECLADCKKRADEDTKRYKAELEVYMEKHRNALQETHDELALTVSDKAKREYFARAEAEAEAAASYK